MGLISPEIKWTLEYKYSYRRKQPKNVKCPVAFNENLDYNIGT